MKGKVFVVIIIAILGFIIYRSCKVVPIEQAEKGFNPRKYAQKVWVKLLENMDSLQTVDAVEVLNALDKDPEKAHEKFAKIVGVSNYRYYLVKGTGEIVSIQDDGFTLKIRENRDKPDFFVTTHIFGNSIANSTGIIKMEDFDRINDFNLVSTALNGIVREEVALSFLKQLKEMARGEGSFVKFLGVFTLLRDEEVKYPLELIPLRLELVRGGF